MIVTGDTETIDSGWAMIGWAMAYLGAIGLFVAAGAATMGHGHDHGYGHPPMWFALGSACVLAAGWIMVRRAEATAITPQDEDTADE